MLLRWAFAGSGAGPRGAGGIPPVPLPRPPRPPPPLRGFPRAALRAAGRGRGRPRPAAWLLRFPPSPLRGLLPPRPLGGARPATKTRARESGKGGRAAGSVPVRALGGGVCFAGFFIAPSAHPPSQPIGRQPRKAMRAVGCYPYARKGWCLLRRLFYARCAHPPNRPKTPTRESGVRRLRPRAFCAVSGASRPRPLRGLLRAAFAGCFCGEWLRLALPQGAVQTWLAMFHSLPYYGLPLGGRVPQGGAHTLPPSSRPAQSFAGYFCASCSLLLRPVCASLAWLLVAARIRGHPAAHGRLGGSPIAPAPSVRALWVALLPVAPSLPLPLGRASAPPSFCGLLSWAAFFAAIMVPPSLSSVRSSSGRTFVREAMVFWLRFRINYLSMLADSAALRGLFVCRRSFALAFALQNLAALRAAGAAYGSRHLFAAAADAAAADKNR